ncbi:TRAP transporter small permease [Planktomarina temperata]|nr:TRAP transporter small permease [Planktomarina temperata]MDC3324949.1 TRAP transporter small permease [Planktomarina temperata]
MPDTKTQPTFIKKIDSVSDIVVRICIFLAAVSLVFMTVFYVWLVYGRYVLNDTPTWVEQVSLLLVMVMTFLGAAVGVHQHSHLSVVVFRNAVPMPVRNFFVLITDLLMIGFGGMMCWYGIKLTLFKWNTLIPLIQVSEGFRSLPLTICGALVFLFSIGHLIRLLTGSDERQDNIDEG